jgi:hypothetical protein
MYMLDQQDGKVVEISQTFLGAPRVFDIVL